MTQVNKYADSAAYTADTKRSKTQSAVSLIEAESTVVYDGVNVVVDKGAAEIGDLVVYDKTAKKIAFVKWYTLNKATLPAALEPVAVVYARKGDTVLIVSLTNATSTNQRWAHSFQVRLTGFVLSAAGNVSVSVQAGTAAAQTATASWAANASLDDVAASLTAAFAGLATETNQKWTAEAVSGGIVLSHNWYTASKVTEVAGASIIAADGIDYQTTLTGVLIPGKTTEYVRRNNRTNSSYAGCNTAKFIQYYSANGTDTTGITLGSTTIIRESAFTAEANPDLVAAYPTYRDYLLGEHMLQYPCAYGAVLRNGKENTQLIGTMRYTDVNGESAPCYPAAAAALDYGINIDGETTGLEAGAWWLPSVDEMYLLMHDRAYNSTTVNDDPINLTLSRMGKTTAYGNAYYPWTCCECSSHGAFVYDGSGGTVHNYYKYGAYAVRPVSAL